MKPVPGDSDAVPQIPRLARAGLIGSALTFAVIWMWDLGLEPRPHHLLAVFAAVIVLWVTEALPIAVTALLIAPLLVLTEVTDAKTAFAPYAHPLLFLFVGGFMIARSMTRHGLDRRIAIGLVSVKWVAGIPWRVRMVFMLTGVLLSMWISNTATTAILLPILLGMCPPGDKSPSTVGSVLAIAYACSIGGLGTPVGSPPNLIVMGFLEEQGVSFSFVDWMMIGVPAAAVMLTMNFFLFQKRSPPVISKVKGDAHRMGAWSVGEKWTAVAFGLAVIGWMVPGIMQAAEAPHFAEVKRLLPGGAVALLAASLLFGTRDEKGDRVLPWKDAAQIDWGIIMLFGGGLSLGAQMIDTGLAGILANGFVEVTGVSGLWMLVFLVTVFTIFFTEACSNTATSNMLAPLVWAIAERLEVSAIPPLLAVGLAASCAFMLPIATGPNAIAFGTGRIPQSEMMRAGLWLNLACAVAIWILLRVLCPLYGWV